MPSIRILVILTVVCILAGTLAQQAEAQCGCGYFRCNKSECYAGKCGLFNFKHYCCDKTSIMCDYV
ncbi:hypothetical protein DPMN_029973 [Dreissena polymorpha]|uniref:Uncharacterized protein n=1 Tax=Dreissena polymorpha TaxID=45954 RepID=A0A9D4RHV9_DREPO|nr:hypothetical protein DPMN_029973 [Dreissena polymorpha]